MTDEIVPVNTVSELDRVQVQRLMLSIRKAVEEAFLLSDEMTAEQRASSHAEAYRQQMQGYMKYLNDLNVLGGSVVHPPFVPVRWERMSVGRRGYKVRYFNAVNEEYVHTEKPRSARRIKQYMKRHCSPYSVFVRMDIQPAQPLHYIVMTATISRRNFEELYDGRKVDSDSVDA